MDKREYIASRAARFLEDGDLVNLGIGIPTLCTKYVVQGVQVLLHSENGIIGMGPPPKENMEDKYIVDAGATPATIVTGGTFCDICMSFAIMRGGHLDKTIIGAMQVDSYGSFASWKIPGKVTFGMGGAMDLAEGARCIIVAMEHCTKSGAPKILKECTYPLTARNRVTYIVTELCTFKCENDGLHLIELAQGVTVEQVEKVTGADFAVDIFSWM